MVLKSDERPMFGPVKLARYVTEFIGTMFLILSIRVSTSIGSTIFASFGIGFTLVIIVYSFGWISGAHFNPAVTLAVLVRGNVPSFSTTDYGQIVMYLVSQFLGALLGGIIGNFIGDDLSCFAGPIINTDDFNLGQGFVAELFFTFFLTFVILNVGTHQAGNQFYGSAIGFTLFISIICIGNVTGCVLNPSVWFGLTMAGIICDADDSTDGLQDVWVYFGSQLLAACISGAVFRFVLEPAAQVLENGSSDVKKQLHIAQESNVELGSQR